MKGLTPAVPFTLGSLGRRNALKVSMTVPYSEVLFDPGMFRQHEGPGWLGAITLHPRPVTRYDRGFTGRSMIVNTPSPIRSTSARVMCSFGRIVFCRFGPRLTLGLTGLCRWMRHC
jgi:hypothetical protein